MKNDDDGGVGAGVKWMRDATVRVLNEEHEEAGTRGEHEKVLGPVTTTVVCCYCCVGGRWAIDAPFT